MSESVVLELDDFDVIEGHGTTIYVRHSLRPELGDKELVLLPEKLHELPSMRSRSRKKDTIWFLPGKSGDIRFVVRKYFHGGLWGKIVKDLFIGHERMLRELALYEYAWKSGVPTSQTAALRIEHSFGPLCKGYLVTVEIKDALNLEAYCASVAKNSPPFPEVLAMSQAIARALQKVHDCGIHHGDLNVRNILVRHTTEGPEAFVIDFDKATLMSAVPLDARMTNLVRLDRSVLKWPTLRSLLRVTDRLRLARDYLSGYPQWGPQWKRILRMYRTHHLRHRFSHVKEDKTETNPATG